MVHHRHVFVLLSVFLISAVFDASACRSQSSSPYQNQWSRPISGPGDRGFIAYANANYLSPYDPVRIESARRSANQYRAKFSANSLLVSEQATINASLADQWADLALNINAVAVRLAEANAQLKSATLDYENVGSKLRQFGLTPTIGLLLSHKKTQLEDWRIDGSAGQRVHDEIQRSRQKQFENEMILHDGSEVESQTAEILAAAGFDANRIEYPLVVSQVQSLLRQRSDWMHLLSQGYEDYRKNLAELETTSAAFEKLTLDYRKLINRHVTWIRSGDPLGIADVRNFSTGLGALFDARRSSDFGYSLNQKWSSNPASGLTLLAITLIIFLLRILAKTWLIGLGKRKRMREATANTRKFVASLLTPLVAIAIPSILYLIARWLCTGYVTESTLHVSSGLYAASFVALIIEVPRQLLRTHGFIERHLKIELPRRQRASAYLLLVGTGLVLASYVVTVAEHIDHGIWSDSVARLGFIASLLLVAWTAHLALKPSGGFVEPLIETFGGNVLYRVRALYYVLGVGFPLLMVALSGLGYKHTATEIIGRAGFTFVSILIGATVWSGVKILSAAAWHALTETQAEGPDNDRRPASSSEIKGALAERSLELKHQMAFLCQCSLVLAALVYTGWLWIDILPSVQMGNPVVWSVQDTVTVSSIDANGQELTREEIATTSITVLHLIIAGAVLFVAFQLAKLLPAIFDALVLQRVSFDEAMEHLTLVIGRCLLFGVGVFIACRLIGVRWEAIQWLAVGLTIGLGFGLQDMVRNVFGGLIVLFEKPARLGDLISVGNVTGRVATQKLRTTVLFDDEGRSVIIPNKNFVSQDVVNWMGAGRLRVIPIEVVVTRDERPADVCRMLQQLLVKQPNLLLSPAPQATLICVSQKSQRIELRAWIEEHQDILGVRQALTKLVLDFLNERNLLASHQPHQPSLDASSVVDSMRDRRTRSKRSA